MKEMRRCQHAGHAAERPRLGFVFARNAAAEASYSSVPPCQKERPKLITGVIRWVNSAIHFVAESMSGSSSSHRTPILFCFIVLGLVEPRNTSSTEDRCSAKIS